MKRNDIHRIGAIVPADYDHVLFYSLPTTEEGVAIPAFGVNCELDRRTYGPKGEIVREGTHDPDGRCCVLGLAHVAKVSFADHGGTGKCTFCGAVFVHGAVWVHRPTGVYVHLGHTCADKYDMLASSKDFDARRDAAMRNHAARLLAEKRRIQRDAFLTDRPDLARDLQTDHAIVRDIAEKLYRFGSLSDAQIALVAKIAAEAREPKPEPERLVPAPEGRVTVRGTIVSLKLQDSAYGSTWRMAVKVSTSEGNWIAWGTCPSLIVDTLCNAYDGVIVDRARGAVVQFTATLERSTDKEHFAFVKRPTKASVISLGTPAENRHEPENKP